MEYGNIDSIPELEHLPSLSDLLQDGFILFGPDRYEEDRYKEDPDNDYKEYVDERTGQTEIFSSVEEVEGCIEEMIDEGYKGRFKIIRITPNNILSLEKVVEA